MITGMDNYYDFDINELLNDPILPEPVLYPQNDLVFIISRIITSPATNPSCNASRVEKKPNPCRK